MGSRVKKDRRASGVRFTKPTKEGTPVTERENFRGLVPGLPSTRDAGKMVPRSEKKLTRIRKKWGIAA